MASLTKWWLLEAYFVTHHIQPRHNNYKIMRVGEHAHLIHVHVHYYVPTHIYIADMRTKEVSICTITSELSVFS